MVEIIRAYDVNNAGTDTGQTTEYDEYTKPIPHESFRHNYNIQYLS